MFTLYQDGRKTSQTVTLDGVVDENGETDAWVASFEGLEKYKADGVTEHEYTIKELTGYTGYSSYIEDGSGGYEPGNTVADKGTIYNRESRTVKVVKVWQNSEGTVMTTPPTGKTVTITLKKNGTVDKTAELDGRVDIYYEQNAWEATFSDLEVGATYYTIEETGAPAGFTLVSCEITEGASNSGNATWTVTNQEVAGVELPATGGPGTALYTYLGLMILLLAGGLLVFSKRRSAREKG